MCVQGAYAHIYVWEEHWVHMNEVEPHWFMCRANVCCLLNLELAFQTSGGQHTQNDWEALQVNALLKVAMKRKRTVCTHSCQTEIKPTSPRAQRPIRGSEINPVGVLFQLLHLFPPLFVRETLKTTPGQFIPTRRRPSGSVCFKHNQCCSAFCFHHDRLIGAGPDVHNNLPAPTHRWHDASSYHRLGDNTKALGVMAALWLYVVGRLGMGESHESTSLYDRECSACLTKETSWRQRLTLNEWPWKPVLLLQSHVDPLTNFSTPHPHPPPLTPPMPPPATRTSVPG